MRINFPVIILYGMVIIIPTLIGLLPLFIYISDEKNNIYFVKRIENINSNVVYFKGDVVAWVSHTMQPGN